MEINAHAVNEKNVNIYFIFGSRYRLAPFIMRYGLTFTTKFYLH